MTPDARFEYKYILDAFDYFRIRNKIAIHFSKDDISRRAQDGRYLVRSLYYDSYAYQAYYEKVVGENHRTKLRLRAYGDTIEGTPFVSVEHKIRRGKLIFKHSTRVSTSEYLHFMQTGHWEGDHPVLDDFKNHIHRTGVVPRVIVQYRREAYVARGPQNVRLTLDTDLKYGNAKQLFIPSARLKSDLTRKIILEIKGLQDDIDWLNRFIRDQDLGTVPNSKYADAIEHTQHPLWL
jgi:SPX domain protein involved in polyphosphate accumulation